MKVVLVAPPILDREDGRLVPAEMDAVRVCPPYGTYLLTSVLRGAGHDVVLVDLIARGTNILDDAALADIDGAGLVGISATSLSWSTALDVARQVRARNPAAKIVAGNVHATLFDTYLVRTAPVDFVVRGEGEIALPALCAALDRGGSASDLATVPNLTWLHDGRVVRNALGPPIDHTQLLDAPLPAYDELPHGAYKGLAIESSRGCALDCSFCSTPYRRAWRGAPVDAFVDRLEAMLVHVPRTRFGVVHVIDDEFSMSPKRAAEIARAIDRRGLRPQLIFDSRAIDFLREGFAEAIAPFTFRFLLGAECGYDEGLKRVGKGITCQTLEDAAAKLHALGMAEKGEFSFILGLPWEGFAEVEKTLRFAARLFATYGVIVRLNWYTQMPGSVLWEEDRKREAVGEAMYDDYGFYRDLHLFRSGVKLTPSEVWRVGDIVDKLQLAARARYPEREQTIDFFFPGAIARYFPRETLRDAKTDDTGLINLRKIARPDRTAVAPAKPER
jgi:radical SAM superfamily enzyme YgiQ (UPF0313 family)